MSPSVNHSYLCKKILFQIENSEHWEAWPELTLEGDLIPDIAVYRKGELKPNFLKDVKKVATPPVLVIEILSPSQAMQDLIEKAENYYPQGILAVWIVEPYTQAVLVLTPESSKVVHQGWVETEGVRVDFEPIFQGELENKNQNSQKPGGIRYQ